MAQSNTAKDITYETLNGTIQADQICMDGTVIEPTNVMTGDKDRQRFLLYQLKLSMMQAQKIDIIVSFLMESGVRLILKDLKSALLRGVQIRILTGNYLGITQPSALYLIRQELGCSVSKILYLSLCRQKRDFYRFLQYFKKCSHIWYRMELSF